MTITIDVTDAAGGTHRIGIAPDETLMEALRERGLVLGTCGGMCSCGTCHVFIDQAETLPDPTEDEADMLEALADVVQTRTTSRLSCQINTTNLAPNAAITIAPQF